MKGVGNRRLSRNEVTRDVCTACSAEQAQPVVVATKSDGRLHKGTAPKINDVRVLHSSAYPGPIYRLAILSSLLVRPTTRNGR
jgi:hypothetical protein